MRCCVPGCGQRSEKGISFHKFPTKEPNRTKKWVNAITKFLREGSDDEKCFTPKTSYVICSKHFDSSDYIPVQNGRSMLKTTACPSIFLCNPNAKRQRRFREGVINVATSVLCKIAPKPELRNTENNSVTKSLLPEILDTSSKSNEPSSTSAEIDKIDSQEPNCMCNTPKRRIAQVKTQFSENISEQKSESPTTTIGSDVSVTTQIYNNVSEKCVSCSDLRRENETLRAEIIALKKLVVTLTEERERSQTPLHSNETVTEGATSHSDADNVCSKPTSCRIVDNTTTSHGQESLTSLQKAVRLDHRYESTPRTLKRKLESSESQKKIIIKRARLTTKKLKRTQLKVAEMKQMIKSLVEEVNLRPEVAEHIEKVFGSVPLELYKRSSLVDSSGKKKVRKQYSATLRAFAVTLHFYSPRAYEFVRQQFGLGLPHTSTIRGWYHEIQSEPGLTEDSFTALQVKANEYSAANKTLYCAMMFDDMHLKKQVEWDGTKYHGFCTVGKGTGYTKNGVEAATQALVIMVVGLDGSWKVPLGYFFHNGLVSHEIADLILKSLQRLHSIGRAHSGQLDK